jgi:glycerol-1-phosphate dehydrogenase [NAD(P)+]
VGPKLLDADGADALNARLERTWGDIRDRIAAITVGAEALHRALTAAGAATTPAELGWSEERYASARRYARAVRNRYTFLDLAADARIL